MLDFCEWLYCIYKRLALSIQISHISTSKPLQFGHLINAYEKSFAQDKDFNWDENLYTICITSDKYCNTAWEKSFCDKEQFLKTICVAEAAIM